ncbi:E3 ubiquitin-protein ligase TRIM11-like [Rana temporaria]|uniref:E3 ubiquitin-protein ligase TRIM11-like n=1 Tax=Rana temporaria TaxID=8407 RepID=UPI001AADF3EA|nr:E3 ubiquitin-protein ligase TRIM11-like [Rana temporaria]
MASSHLKENLECSVCLNIFKDPVTLRCGHHFCRDCIGRVLDTQWGTGGYSCPECRENFKKRPVPQTNMPLCQRSEALRNTQGGQDKTGISCTTSSIHAPVPAVKSYVMCDDDLRVPSKSPEHVLCDPTTPPENRKCSIHKEILEYYCTEDSSCICIFCRLDGEHRGHQVETLDEASEKKNKKLINVLQKLKTEREETEKRVQSLQEHRWKVQGKADDETERATALFRDLRRRLEDLEKRVLKEISGQAEQVSLSLSDLIQQLETKMEELSRKMEDIEELCNMTDPLTFLQKSDTGDLCDTEDGDHENREGRDKLLHDGGDLDLDVAGILHTLHTGLSDIMSEVYVQKCTGTLVYPHFTTKGKGPFNAEPSRRCPQPTLTIQPSKSPLQPTPTVQLSHHQAEGPNIGATPQTSGVSGVTDILLDVRTAGNNLHISDDRKTVSWLYKSQNHPEAPERFRCPQVMSSQSFSSGRHYWEVDVGRAWMWRTGMCYPSIDRRGDQSLIGYNKKSWCLERWGCNQYSVVHDDNKTRLPCRVSSERVRIDLDYEAGRISFYDLCDPIRHLHTFTTTFTEPLHAGVCVVDDCIKICGEESDVRNLPRVW